MLGAFFLCTTTLVAKEKISFTSTIENETSVGNGLPKVPMQPPTVFIEGYTLLFAVDHPDYVMNIKDEDGDFVYTTYVYPTQTQVVLPSSLSGSYEIELLMGIWKFTGYITL